MSTSLVHHGFRVRGYSCASTYCRQGQVILGLSNRVNLIAAPAAARMTQYEREVPPVNSAVFQ